MGKTAQTLTLFLMFLILIGWTHGEENVTKHYSSYHGMPCKKPCSTYGKDYFWCETKGGWDYCSPREKTDYKGQPCRKDHHCGKYGKSYHWCYTKGDDWGYCGILRNAAEPKTLLYKGSSYMSVCWDECAYDEKKQYFWCHTDEGWDYCSPLPDVTYRNEQCRLDHYCSPHDSGYTWCLTNSGYDYCGLISPGECQDVIPESTKEDSNTVVSCTWKDQKKEKEIKFKAQSDLTLSAEGSIWKNEIINFIARWKNTYLNPEPGSKVITSKNLRFDTEKLVIDEGQRYDGLQIKVNVHAQSGRSPKLAQVDVPEYDDIPDRFVRLAFMKSFHHRARILMDVNVLS